MKQIRTVLLALVATILVGCGTSSTVPITGRKRTLMVSDEQVLSLSNQQYQQYMQSAKPSTNAANTAMVKRVGQNLANAVVAYLNANGLGSEVSPSKWEFNLVQDQQVNAFCMPGGKIVVYEGLLPVTRDETSLAIVLGHEIAHAVAKHSAEQMSTAIKQQYGAQALGVLMAGAGFTRPRERGRPSGHYLCRYGWLRPRCCCQLLAAHVTGYRRRFYLLAEHAPQRCYAHQADSGLVA